MRSVVWSVVLVMVAAGSAAAQPVETRGAVSGIAGAGRTWDDEGSLGTGTALGARVEWRLFGNTSVEGSLDTLSHDRRGGFFQAEGRTTFAGASLVTRFGRALAQPYILGGVHLATHSGSTTVLDMRVEHDSTDVGYHFGGGVAIRFGRRFEAGPEARFYMIQPGNDADPAMAYWVGARFGVRF